MKYIQLLFFFISTVIYAQQGGMWIPSLLKGQNEKEMKALGMKISAQDIYDINKSSLKDAVPHFDGGCTSEVISPKGLLLTNHHCGYEQIQTHSSLTNNYINDGFWAKSLEEELPNQGMEVTFIVRIEDVTQAILKGVENVSSLDERQHIIEKNMSQVSKNTPKEPWQENRIKTFYKGNQFLLFVVETFKDIRLVGAPPSSIGKFGSDTDNWVWPRHTGDFALFRIYADKNNRPAEYSKENVPYKPKHYFPISLKGLKENDFTMIFGYPGTTNEYLPAVAVEQLVEVLNPAKINIREAALKIQDKYMRQDAAIKIQYASKNARIANYWKKWKGESLGLIKTNAVAKKRMQENIFTEKVNQSGKQNQYGHLLYNFQQKYKDFEKYALSMDIFQEIVLRNVEILSNGFKIYQLNNVYQSKGEQAFSDRRDNLVKDLEKTYKDYSSRVDKEIFSALMEIYIKQMPAQFVPKELTSVDINTLTNTIFEQSALTSYDKVQQLLAGSPSQVANKVTNDKAMQLVSQITTIFFQEIVPMYQHYNSEIAELQRTYMKAILEFSTPKDRIFPDANSTLRVTYGKIAGYTPADAIYYQPFTYLEGVMEKYIPNDYEFDVPAKLRELYDRKDYGIYADKNGKMPVCFIATNHTTGGNSGSPAIDAHGNLIGLNFDRVWEGTMSDIYYDPSICRNIMVDIRYVLFIIDKYAGATNIINELKLVK